MIMIMIMIMIIMIIIHRCHNHHEGRCQWRDDREWKLCGKLTDVLANLHHRHRHRHRHHLRHRHRHRRRVKVMRKVNRCPCQLATSLSHESIQTYNHQDDHHDGQIKSSDDNKSKYTWYTKSVSDSGNPMKQVEGDRYQLSSRSPNHVISSFLFLFALFPICPICPIFSSRSSNHVISSFLFALFLHPFHFPLSWFGDNLNSLVISRFVFKLFEFQNRQFCSLLNQIQLLKCAIPPLLLILSCTLWQKSKLNLILPLGRIPDNSQLHQLRCGCKIFQVRGIFSILNATMTPV